MIGDKPNFFGTLLTFVLLIFVAANIKRAANTFSLISSDSLASSKVPSEIITAKQRRFNLLCWPRVLRFHQLNPRKRVLSIPLLSAMFSCHFRSMCVVVVAI